MKSVMQHDFGVVPVSEIQRSNFNRSCGIKGTMQADTITPIFFDECLPGDTFNLKPTIFARLATPQYPLMDNMYIDLHWFAIPMRQVWDNFRKFMGEQVDPGDSTDYTIPVNTVSGTIASGTLEDFMGLPTHGTGVQYNALFERAFWHVYNEWYRDQNLIDTHDILTGNTGESLTTGTTLPKRGKRHDYFTSGLPWLQKGDAVSLPLGDTAPIQSVDNKVTFYSVADSAQFDVHTSSGSTYLTKSGGNSAASNDIKAKAGAGQEINWIETDLSSATASTINELRQAFQIQALLEKDARSGTRYSEVILSHFGVTNQQESYRPEYLGGSSTPINIHSVAATSESNANLGDLGAFGTALLDSGGFVKSFTEHSIIIGIASVRADLTYSQGIERMYSRSTRYDFYWPTLAHLGEQGTLNKEIYYSGDSNDDGIFNYQERYAEYKYKKSVICGQLKPDHATSLKPWHLSEEFGSLPSFNQTFIESNTPIDRVVQTPSEPDFIFDAHFNLQCARPMPVFSVPGLKAHF